MVSNGSSSDSITIFLNGIYVWNKIISITIMFIRNKTTSWKGYLFLRNSIGWTQDLDSTSFFIIISNNNWESFRFCFDRRVVSAIIHINSECITSLSQTIIELIRIKGIASSSSDMSCSFINRICISIEQSTLSSPCESYRNRSGVGSIDSRIWADDRNVSFMFSVHSETSGCLFCFFFSIKFIM